jgi:hypothetical protein
MNKPFFQTVSQGELKAPAMCPGRRMLIRTVLVWNNGCGGAFKTPCGATLRSSGNSRCPRWHCKARAAPRLPEALIDHPPPDASPQSNPAEHDNGPGRPYLGHRQNLQNQLLTVLKVLRVAAFGPLRPSTVQDIGPASVEAALMAWETRCTSRRVRRPRKRKRRNGTAVAARSGRLAQIRAKASITEQPRQN